jgi:hypothetical protein
LSPVSPQPAGRSLPATLFALLIFGACRSGLQEETVTSARPMAGVVAYGDCVEARRRAAIDPGLDVDSVPRPVSQRPRPFANMPAAVKTDIARKGSTVKVDVVVDTLGRADMATFKVVQSTHPWLAQNLRAAMPTWTFRAARLAGCKVRRVYHFSATSKPSG